MEIYWYWPWPYERADGLARGTVRGADRLIVHALDSDLAPRLVEQPDTHTVLDDLPAPLPLRERSPRWAVDRSTMLIRRARRRAIQVGSGTYDIAHVHLLNLNVDPWSLPSLGRRVPIVSTVHDVRPHHRRWPDKLEHRLLDRVYEHAGTLVVYHASLRDRLVEEFDVEVDRINVIPHPIRTFDPGPAEPAADSYTVLFFGALRWNKGVDVLLDAINQLQGTDLRFRVAGRGVSELEALVADAEHRLPNLGATLRFIPAEERRRLYHQADLVVLPYTEFASQSGVLADAYSFGVPLVVTDVGALGQTVREDGTGWVVAPGDPGVLAETLERAMGDTQSRRTMSERMRRLADERSEAATGRAFRSLYEEVVDRGGTLG